MDVSPESVPADNVLGLFRTHGQLSRTDVMELTGLSRSTVNQRLTALAESGLIVGLIGGESTGGRPSSRFEYNAERAVVLTVDIGATGFIVAVCDLTGKPIDYANASINVWEGPDIVLDAVKKSIDTLPLTKELWAIAIGVPGPVEFDARRVVKPPIMTGWDEFDIVAWFAKHFDAPVTVENDANARAIAEARHLGVDNLVSLKLGTGIGAGLVFNGQIIRGNKGAAGDIGHTQAAGSPLDGKICRCGNLDCVESYAGGWAIQRDLKELGIDTSDLSEIVSRVQQGDMQTVRLVRGAGRIVGDAIADLVSILNPGHIVLSGQLAECGEILMSGIRERVYQHTVPLATSDLHIIKSNLGELAGVIGLSHIALDSLFRQRTFE